MSEPNNRQEVNGSEPVGPPAADLNNIMQARNEYSAEPKKHSHAASMDSRIKLIALLTSIVTLLTAVVTLLNKFEPPSEPATPEKQEFRENVPARKIQSIVQETVDQFFNDTKVEVRQLDSGEKTIEIHVFTYNDNRVNSKTAVEMAETLFAMISKKDSGIAAIEFVYNSATGKAKVSGGGELLLPLVIWPVIKTSSAQGDEIWVSTLILANRDVFQNADIFKYEYEQSKVFWPIDHNNLDLDEAAYSNDFSRIMLR